MPLPQDTELARQTPAMAPEQLTDVCAYAEADAAKVTGVPSGMWGAERQPRAVNEMVRPVARRPLSATTR